MLPTVAPELRKKERLYTRVPVLVRGKGPGGARFEQEAVLENISRGGLYVRLGRRLELGARLFALVRFPASPVNDGRGPLFAVSGRVLRVEPGPDGGWGAAVAITGHRFL